MVHYDLFSGIGGFSLAADQVWPGLEHIFCDIDPFCRAVTEKHWPGSKHYGDIRQLIADTERKRNRGIVENSDGPKGTVSEGKEAPSAGINEIRNGSEESAFIVTGGFPCQPFSQAGRRRGTDDDRYLWPSMFRVIQNTKPTWVIAENVRGLLTIEDGLVFEQVCADLESEGYEVQPFVIPACAVNAPHRRDRVWIVGYSKSAGKTKIGKVFARRTGNKASADTIGDDKQNEQGFDSDFKRTGLEREQPGNETEGQRNERSGNGSAGGSDWNKNWIEVAAELCRVDDGLPAGVDGLELSKSAHRRERLKSLGNAIVPQVVMEIMRAMKNV